MDPNVTFKNLVVAMILLAFIAFAALMHQPGANTGMGMGGGFSSQGWNTGSGGWRGGDDDDDWDDD